MKVLCAWCLKAGRPAYLGERDPLENPTVTHGICTQCADRIRAEQGFAPRLVTKPQSARGVVTGAALGILAWLAIAALIYLFG